MHGGATVAMILELDAGVQGPHHPGNGVGINKSACTPPPSSLGSLVEAYGVIGRGLLNQKSKDLTKEGCIAYAKSIVRFLALAFP